MQAVVFYLLLPFIYLLSLLPFRLLYGVSDMLYFNLYYVFGYRKKVVFENLRNSFPEKTPKEIENISKKFYAYFCDLIVETFKTLTINPAQVVKRCKFDEASLTLFEKYHAKKQNLIFVMGHYGNWEWGGLSFSLSCKHQLYVIYKPLFNSYFNRLIYKMRTRLGTKLIAMNNTYKEMLENTNEVNATAFIADQTPAPESAYWTEFLNQQTPVSQGTEKIAKKLKYPLVFINIRRIRRGYYSASAEVLFENPEATKAGEISEAHTLKLEQEIKRQPELWLWSHKRWKHKKSKP